MDMDIRFDCMGVDWQLVSDTLKRIGISYHKPGVQRKAFENSYAVVFVYRGGGPSGQMIGFGRAISDGAYQAAIYDVAVIPEYQRQGIGTEIVKQILARLPSCNVILYEAPGKEGFYGTLGLRKMKTAMALFRKAEIMQEKGFTD
jgi:ribosomal protein S18 acetylase RimI-like enzyme